MKKNLIINLEIIRFLAAINIVTGHYGHFYEFFNLSKETLPYYEKIQTPYSGSSVFIFFLMSGAIFFHNYEDKIKSNKIKLYDFIKKRFARLAPLHWITLIFSFLLQLIIIFQIDKYFIYNNNNTKEFLIHFFFLYGVLSNTGGSFNSPSWSISTEMLMYFLFFLMVKMNFFLNTSVIFKYMFIIIFLFFLQKVFSFTFIHLLKTQTFIIEYNLVLKSFFAFNVGCLIYCLSKKIKENKRKFNRFAYLIITIFLIMILDKFFSEAIPNGSIPVIILFFAIYFDFAFKKMNFLLNYLGNISYSIYLIHFPVQLILIIVNYNFILLNFETISVFWIYIFLTITLGSLSYYFFETPIKRKLLNKF